MYGFVQLAKDIALFLLMVAAIIGTALVIINCDFLTAAIIFGSAILAGILLTNALLVAWLIKSEIRHKKHQAIRYDYLAEKTADDIKTEALKAKNATIQTINLQDQEDAAFQNMLASGPFHAGVKNIIMKDHPENQGSLKVKTEIEDPQEGDEGNVTV